MTWLMLVGMTFITFLNRYAFFSEIVRIQPGDKAKCFLSYSSYAILTAIWTPIIFHINSDGTLSSAGLDYLAAASLAAIMSFFRIRSIFVVLVGTSLFFCLRFWVL